MPVSSLRVRGSIARSVAQWSRDPAREWVADGGPSVTSLESWPISRGPRGGVSPLPRLQRGLVAIPESPSYLHGSCRQASPPETSPCCRPAFPASRERFPARPNRPQRAEPPPPERAPSGLNEVSRL